MSSVYAREVVLSCNYSIVKMQTVADLLLLGDDLRPVSSESLTGFVDSYPNCRELVITRTKGLLVLIGRINEHLHKNSRGWRELDMCVQDVCELVVALTESCSHSTYLLSLTFPNNVPPVAGIVDAYKVKKAGLNIDLWCQILKQASCDQLAPPLLVHICTQIKQNLSILTECCKTASEKSRDQLSRDQFELCIKSFTSSASCFLNGIKMFKCQSVEPNRQRCISFADSMVACIESATGFATEKQFCGRPGQFTSPAVNAKMAILGACMSIVSSSIQLCKVIKDVACETSRARSSSYDRLQQCMEATSRASSQLATAYNRHQADSHDKGCSQNHNPR